MSFNLFTELYDKHYNNYNESDKQKLDDLYIDYFYKKLSKKFNPIRKQRS